MRGLIRSIIIENEDITDLIPADSWFGSGSAGKPPEEKDRPAVPFAEIRFGGTFPGMSVVQRGRCEIWIHEEFGSYDLINRVIRLLRPLVESAVQVDFDDAETGEQSHLVQAEWISDSPDLYDTGYRTNTRSTGFDLVGTGL